LDRFSVWGCDIALPQAGQSFDSLRLAVASAENLPWRRASFDTILCTHVLEHLRKPQAALAELRRVARKRIIIVLPKERPYQFGFNLHLNFFPYAYSVMQTVARDKGRNNARLDLVGGDWFYIEDKESDCDGSG
jgi:ubiquinone/menaquinone biosynthesis C-methylase UbiE